MTSSPRPSPPEAGGEGEICSMNGPQGRCANTAEAHQPLGWAECLFPVGEMKHEEDAGALSRTRFADGGNQFEDENEDEDEKNEETGGGALPQLPPARGRGRVFF